MQLTTQYTYSATDPLQKAKDGNFPTVDLGNAPSNYWSQALLVYWWDQLSVNLTQANNATFKGNLQTVLLQGCLVLSILTSSGV